MSKIDSVIIPDTMSFLELQLNVVQVQQWLTDISATRGTGGYDDGFREAEKYYNRANKILERHILINKNNSAQFQKFSNLKSSMGNYYKVGKKMARALRLLPRRSEILPEEAAMPQGR